MMRLCAIFIVWHDWDLLIKSQDNIEPIVDGIITVASENSNFGSLSNIPECRPVRLLTKEHFFVFEPSQKFSPHENETMKRNFGLQAAKEQGYTHFIMMDSDEFYMTHDLEGDKQYLMDNQSVNGLVYRLRVLFKKPTLWVNDHTLVPGIHKLNQQTQCGKFPNYPFAKDNQGNYHIDPTRRLSYNSGIEMSNTIMWHASWIRKDVNIKIQNSAARNNLQRSSIYKDMENADIGVYNEFYRDTLKECPNYFNL